MSKRPWIVIVLILALFVTANAAVFIAAQLSHGPDLLPVAEAEKGAP